MKKFTLAVVAVLLFCSFAMGQYRKMDALSDTVAYNNNIAYISKLGLQDISKSLHKKHWRFWANQVVDIWSDDDEIYHGSILNYIYKANKKRSVIVKVELVDTVRSKTLIKLFKQLQMDTIPSDKKISGWNYQIADGGSVCLAYSGPNKYSYRTYFCPDMQSVRAAVIINDFFNQVYKILALGKSHTTFINELPLGNYSWGMVSIRRSVHMRAKGGSIWDF